MDWTLDPDQDQAADRVLFGRVLAARRAALAMTQFRLSIVSGVSQTWISRIENGRSAVNLVALRRLARALGIRPQDILTAVEDADRLALEAAAELAARMHR